MKNSISILILLGVFHFSKAQLGIGTTTPHSSAQLEVASTSKGILIPRMNQSQMAAISSPAAGLQVFNTTKNCIYTYNGLSWTAEKKYIGKFVSTGTAVTLDNIKIQIPTTGNQALQIATVSGSVSLSGSSMNQWYNSTSTGAATSYETFIRQSETFSTSFIAWQAAAHFTRPGGYQLIYIIDETNSKAYKLTFIHGASSSNHYLEIEQLY
jgi:hypothetical protein